jgi:hypothetical protein
MHSKKPNLVIVMATTEISWEDLHDLLQGCTLLIGLTFVDGNGHVVEQYQTHGTFETFTTDYRMQIRRPDGTLFRLPYEPETISEAAPGEYRERSTGTVITDPDYLVRWTITVNPDAPETIAEIKREGFQPAVG